jgi:hypothetical protein
VRQKATKRSLQRRPVISSVKGLNVSCKGVSKAVVEPAHAGDRLSVEARERERRKSVLPAKTEAMRALDRHTGLPAEFELVGAATAA